MLEDLEQNKLVDACQMGKNNEQIKDKFSTVTSIKCQTWTKEMNFVTC